MPPTILHVEDDVALAELVKLAFEGFGFRGTNINAESVAEAAQVLDDALLRGERIDLIISDMNLPDGSGLDVVRRVRGHPVWEHTPILILSGDADPTKVGRAYALGANSYVAKAPRGRSMAGVVKTLYDHWLSDVILPANPQLDRTQRFLSVAVKTRSRCAAFYMRMVERFGDSPSDVAFWLSRAVSEANFANLLTFLQRQLGKRTLPSELLDEIEPIQADTERRLEAIEPENAPSIATRDDAYRRTLDLMSCFSFNLQSLARLLVHLFPVAPMVMEALRDFLARNLDEVAGWVDVHTCEPELHRQSKLLHATAAFLRTLPEKPTVACVQHE